MIANDTLSLEWREEGIAVATMTRPVQMNTLVLELIDGLERTLAVCRREKARVLIVTGSGSSFCAGAHLKYFTDPQSPIGKSAYEIRDNYLYRVSSLFDTIEEAPFVTIAAINGYALGGGFEMALACDFRLMAKAALAGLPEVALGATPNSGGVQKLHRFVGRAKALEWILLGRHVGAAELERWGMLYAISEPEALIADAMALARTLSGLSRQAIAQAKASIYIAEDSDTRTARRAGIEALTSLIGREDWSEGMRAFIEKRKPHFKG